MEFFKSKYMSTVRIALIGMGLVLVVTSSRSLLAAEMNVFPHLLNSADYFDGRQTWSIVVGEQVGEPARARKMNYDQAVAYCMSKEKAGEWRLPTKNELEFFGRKKMLRVNQDSLQDRLEKHGWDKMIEGMWSSTTNDNGGTYVGGGSYIYGGTEPHSRWVKRNAAEHVTCVTDGYIASSSVSTRNFGKNYEVACSNGSSARFEPNHNAGHGYDYTNGTLTFYTPSTRHSGGFRDPSDDEFNLWVGKPFCQFRHDLTPSSEDIFDPIMTKLFWSKVTDVQRMDYDTALKYCARKPVPPSRSGYSWRLPTQDEVRAAMSIDNNNSAWVEGGNNVWTSTGKLDFYYVVGNTNSNPQLTNRHPFSELQKKDQINYVTCVKPSVDPIANSSLVELSEGAGAGMYNRYEVVCSDGRKFDFNFERSRTLIDLDHTTGHNICQSRQ